MINGKAKLGKFAPTDNTHSRQTKITKPAKPPHPKDAWKVMDKREVPANIFRAKKRSLMASDSLLSADSQLSLMAASDTVPGPDSFAELAAALKNNVDLIYEWVYSNVDFVPMWGLQKGAFGTLVDRKGGSFEQASLMVALLRAAGYTANFVAGTIRLTKAEIENLLGSDSTTVFDASEDLLILGQIPYAATYSMGVLQHIDMDHIWVQVEIDGINYVFDPSVKSYTDTAGIDIGAVLSFNETTLVSDAQSGATVTANYVQNFNTANVRSSFAAYATTLLDEIKQNHFAASMDEIVSGRSIEPLAVGTELRQTSLPYQVPAYPTTIWTDVPDAYRGFYSALLFDSSFNVYFYQSFFSDEIYGKRLTLTFTSADVPQLRLDGELVAVGDPVTPNEYMGLQFEVYHPFFSSFVDQVWEQYVWAPGTYLLGNCWGGTSQAMVDHHRQLLTNNLAADPAATEESTLGESLYVFFHMHHAQGNKIEDIYNAIASTTSYWYHFCGIAGYSAFEEAPYFDLVGVSNAFVSRKGDTAAADAVYTANSFIVNGLEAGIMQQNLPVTGINTQRMIEGAIADGQKIFDGTSANWTTGANVRSQLTNWTGLLSSLDSAIAGGKRLVIHEDGATQVQQYVGGGWHEIDGTAMSGLLAGHLLGGIPGLPQSGSQTEQGAKNGPGSTTTGVKGAGGEEVTIDPIGLFSGDFVYDRADFKVGSGDFPYSLELSRHYKSSNRFTDGPLGLGWTHNFATNLSAGSNGLRATGEVSAKEAATVIAHCYILTELALASSPSLTKVLIASMSSIWLMDQMTDNAITLNDISESRTFIKLIDGTFNPPPGYADTMVKNLDGTFTSKNPQQETWEFDVDGLLTDYISPAGVTRTYTYSTGKLSTVTTGMGRTLTFNYTGDRLTSVSDGNGRSVSFTVDGAGNLTAFTDAEGKDITYQYAFPGQLTKMFLPANPTVALVTNFYDSLGRVKAQEGANTGLYTYHLSGRRSEEIDPLGNSRVIYSNKLGSMLRDIDALGQTTEYTRDGLNRLVRTDYPEQNAVEWVYDEFNNVLTKTWIGKPGSGLTDVVQTFTYDPLWNKVETAEDGRGNTTTNTYDVTQGTLLTIERPVVNAQTPTVTFTYNARGQILTRTDETGIVDFFVYDSGTEVLLSWTRDYGMGLLNLVTAFDYDSVGNRTLVTDPRGNDTTFLFDDERRLTQRTESTPFDFVTNYNHDDNGWLTSIQRETSDAANPWQTVSYSHQPGGKLQTITDPVNKEFNFGYDTLGRLISKTDAESRAWLFAYDEISQVKTVTDPMSAAAERRTYSENGRLVSTKDANNNTTTFEWDGFDRLVKNVYPDASFEEFTFDENSNILTQRTRNADTITNTFDALNRLETRQPSGMPLQTMTYDLAGRLLNLNTPTTADPTSGDYEFLYDTAGRLLQQVNPTGQDVIYELDENGNRTKLIWPDAYFAEYAFDELNRLTDIHLNGSMSAAVEFDYDALSRRIGSTHGNGTTSSYSYWLNDDLSMLTHSFVGSTVSFAFGYNNVHQVRSLSASDDSYLWNPLATKMTVYAPPNNLNQYPQVVLPFEYDSNGCLTTDGVNDFTYDVLNRLVEADGPSFTNAYLYDPLNRQAQKEVDDGVTVVTTNYLHDLGEVIAEYDGGGTLLKRYIRGPGADEVLISVALAGTLTFHHHDRLGSIIAQSNSGGVVTNKYQYSPFGETPALTGSTFGFTGQKYDAEFSLYDYKARYYSPALGRFLQPDPIGYSAGDMNLYAYVGNDAVNLTDPDGTTVFGGQRNTGPINGGGTGLRNDGPTPSTGGAGSPVFNAGAGSGVTVTGGTPSGGKSVTVTKGNNIPLPPPGEPGGPFGPPNPTPSGEDKGPVTNINGIDYQADKIEKNLRRDGMTPGDSEKIVTQENYAGPNPKPGGTGWKVVDPGTGNTVIISGDGVTRTYWKKK